MLQKTNWSNIIIIFIFYLIQILKIWKNKNIDKIRKSLMNINYKHLKWEYSYDFNILLTIMTKDSANILYSAFVYMIEYRENRNYWLKLG